MAVAVNWMVDILSGVYAQVESGDSIPHRAIHTSRAAIGNFRQPQTPLDYKETDSIVEALFPGLGKQLEIIAKGGRPLLHSCCSTQPHKSKVALSL